MSRTRRTGAHREWAREDATECRAGRGRAPVAVNMGSCGRRRSPLPARKYAWTKHRAQAQGRSRGEDVMATAMTPNRSKAKCASVSAPGSAAAEVRRVGDGEAALGSRARAWEGVRAGEGGDGREQHGTDGGRTPTVMRGPLAGRRPAAAGGRVPRAARGFILRIGR
eukprot:565259-Pleurochrysis_carterae.AAC.1